MPEKFQALRLYKLSFRQPIKFSSFTPKNIKVFGASYIIWGISTDGDYNIFIYVLSEGGGSGGGAGIQTAQQTGVMFVIVGILAVLGLGLSIILFKDMTEVFGAGGLGLTFALGIGISGFLIFRKLT